MSKSIFENDWIKRIDELKYEDIASNAKNPYPCYFHDDPDSKNWFYWVCQSKFASGETIEWVKCERKQHKKCASSFNVDETKYIWITCKLKNLDPFILPFYCLVRPFEIPKYTQTQKWTEKSQKFSIPSNLYNILNSSNSIKTQIRIQIRWIRLPPPPTSDLECLTPEVWSSNLKGYEHGFPKKGYLKLNNHLNKMFDTPPPPNDTKRRKDEMFELSPYLRLNDNYLEVGHMTNQKDTERYFCAIFVWKNFNKKQITGYVKKNCKLSFDDAISILRKRVGRDVDKPEIDSEAKTEADSDGRELKRQKTTSEEDEIMMDKTIKFKFQWPITRMELKIPARGFYWEHVDWFDLETYISMNTNVKRFNCPTWNKKSVNIYVDSLMHKIWELLVEKTCNIEIKENMIAYWDSKIEIDLEKMAELIKQNASDSDIRAKCFKKAISNSSTSEKKCSSKDDNKENEFDEEEKTKSQDLDDIDKLLMGSVPTKKAEKITEILDIDETNDMLGLWTLKSKLNKGIPPIAAQQKSANWVEGDPIVID